MVAIMPGSCPSDVPSEANEADCIDRRVLTMSKGYVKVTEVMPAQPPHTNLRNGDRSAPGEGSANYGPSAGEHSL
jgi:hypothetical protein